MTLRDLVSIYAAIAPRRHAGASQGRRRRTPPADAAVAAPVLDPVAAWYVTDILRDVPPPLNGSPGRIAYKTGTSYGYRDAWAIGYDGKTVIGVWVGRPDGAPVPGIAGITAAAPILFEAFDRLATPAAPFRPAPARRAVRRPMPSCRRRSSASATPTTTWSPRTRRPRSPSRPTASMSISALAAGADAPLIVKVRNGAPPFTFFANGAPFGQSAFARQESWTPDGPGYVTLSVVDAKGRSDKVKVFID